jgi:hypothetical protein
MKIIKIMEVVVPQLRTTFGFPVDWPAEFPIPIKEPKASFARIGPRSLQRREQTRRDYTGCLRNFSYEPWRNQPPAYLVDDLPRPEITNCVPVTEGVDEQ